jgi:hypothetical protein
MSPFRQSQISETASVRGYMKPASAFHPIAEWEELALELLALQGAGIDSHGGELSCKHAMEMWHTSLWNEYISTPIGMEILA